MKAFLLILVVAAGLAYYFFYHRAQPLATPTPESKEAAQPTPPAADKRGFDDLIALLQQDLNGIPAPLNGPGRPPANAVAIKRKIGSHVSDHPEYLTLVQACELIIQADGQRATFQQACHAEQTRASFGTSMHSGGPMDRSTSTTKSTPKPDPAAEQEAIRARVEGNWQKQRQQTATQVQGLLASLAGKQL